MPFKKIKRGRKKGKYKSPSGRTYSKKQVRAYYATDGWKRKPRKRRRRKRRR